MKRLLVVVLLAVGVHAPTSAQGLPEVGLDVRLVHHHFGPDTPLTLDVVTRATGGEPVTDLRVSVAIHERARSRIGLRRALDGEVSSTPLEAFTFTIGDVRPGAARTLRVTQSLDRLSAFDAAPTGLYPLAVTLRRGTGPALADAVTAIAFVPEPPSEPLRLLPVLELYPPPLRTPSGTPTERAPEILDRLRSTLDGLPVRDAPLGGVVSAILLDELEGLELEGTAEVTDAVDRIAPATSLLTAPDTNLLLPHAAELGISAKAALDAGAATVRDHFDAVPVDVLHPPFGALDATPEGVGAVLLPGERFATTPITPAAPVVDDGVTYLPVDRTIGDRASGARSNLAVSQAVAETAMVYFESPGRRRTLSVVLTWEASHAAAFLSAVASTPWVDLVGPVDATADPAEGSVDLRSPSAPPGSYVRAVARASDAVSDLEAYTLEDNAVAGRLRSAVRASLGTGWWASDWGSGVAWAGGVGRAVEAERRLVTAVSDAVTFTSRQGQIPITITNDASYPVRLDVTVSSTKLRFPSGDTRRLESVSPPGTTVTIPAIAEATGAFPLEITVTSPDGRVVVASQELVVRSTAANVLALALTGGAAIFLIGWYGRRLWTRSRRGTRST